MNNRLSLPFMGALILATSFPVFGQSLQGPWKTGDFQWRVSEPLVAVKQKQLPQTTAPWIAVKDPSVVRFDGEWHLFCTLRKDKQGQGRIRIGCSHFADWSVAGEAVWDVLDLTLDYHGAPQIFFFEPHQLWYLIYQAADESRGLKYGPCYSTNPNIRDASGWTKPKPLYVVPEGENAGLDFWVICDDKHANLLFTTLNGRMWHCRTKLSNFPNRGWSKPQVALKADIFEASHTYRLKGTSHFATLVEAQHGKRRYFKLFLADDPAGPWEPLAASREKPAVSVRNVVNQSQSWATSYSHGEFLRSGHNQLLEVDPSNLQLLFQGASDQEYQKGGYGDITWRLGLLELMEIR